MKFIGKKRLLAAAGAVTAVAAVATLVAGVTFGLFTSSQTQTNGFTAGTVTLSQGASSTCTVNSVMPGDGGSCDLATTYAGNSAYEALDILIATKSGGGTGQTSALYTPAGGGLSVGISDGTTTYTVPTVSTTCPAPYDVGGYTCYGLSNELLRSSGSTVASNTFTTTWSLPSGTDNTYQASSAAIVLNAHAVQAANNTIGCVSQTAGQSCVPSGGFAWG